ncbi:MAG: hypothetical protein C4521_01640 [Actinobacteria bacterium]|nr:MAG: hypothetical protein C4521_01640 [Actinomycetota bacterium]
MGEYKILEPSIAKRSEKGRTMAQCNDCKWFVSPSGSCLLGRNPESCTMAPARRGDDDLFERLMQLSDQEFSEVRSYFRRSK